MFWGVTLESGKRYSQVVESSYHLSMAALEPNIKEVGKSNKYVSVMIEHGKSEFLLCTLEYDRVMQVPLDLVFVEGEEVSFFLNGEGVVHLTGYVTDERQDVDEQSYSEESEEENETSEEDYSSKLMHVDDSTDDSSNEEWIPEKVNKKNTNVKNNKTSKKLNKEFKMKSNITSNYKKSKFKNEDDKNNQYKNSEELKEIHDDDEHTESYEEIEMNNEEINRYFNPKNKKKLKKHKKLALHKNKLTLSPISAPQVPEDMLNEESCLSLKKSKKINNKQKFFKKEKPYSEEEREKFQKSILSTKKKHPKKKQYKSGGGTDI